MNDQLTTDETRDSRQPEGEGRVVLQRLVRRRQPDQHSEYPEIADMKAALNRAGYDASESDIQWAWEEHSEDWAAGWLVLESCGGADGAVKYLLEYLTAESPNGALSDLREPKKGPQ